MWDRTSWHGLCPWFGLSVSPVCRAGTAVTGTSTADPVKSWLGTGEGLWGAVPVFSTPLWNNGAAEVLRVLEQLRRGLVGLSWALQAPFTSQNVLQVLL